VLKGVRITIKNVVVDPDLIPGRGNDFSLLQRIQTGSGTHPASSQ
jgi:hypothetical protein